MGKHRSRDPLVDQHAIEVPCTCCEHSVDTTVREIRDRTQMSCPKCGHTIVLGTSRITAEIRSIESSIGKLRGQLSQSGTFDAAGVKWKKPTTQRRKPNP
jgi:hypothetical protein